MITIENVLIAEADLKTVWQFFSDANAIAACVPTCENHQVIDEDTVSCDLRLKLGVIPLDAKALVKITERRNNRHLEARGETEAGEMTRRLGKVATDTTTRLHIIVDLEAVNAGKTRTYFKINADAVGQMKRVYEAILKSQRAKLEAEFVANVAKALRSKVVLEGPQPR